MVGRWECCNGGTARILTIFRAKITVITARTAVIWRCFSLRSLAHQHRARIRLTPPLPWPQIPNIAPAISVSSSCAMYNRPHFFRSDSSHLLKNWPRLFCSRKSATNTVLHHLCHPLFGYASCSSSMQLLQYICVLLLGYARMLGARHIQITYLAMLCEVVFTTQRGAMMRCWAVCPPTLGLYADSDYPLS